MRTTLIIVILLLVAVAGYAYKTNPAGCAKLGSDLSADLVAIFQPQPKTSEDTAANTSASAPETASAPAPAPPPAPVAKLTPVQAWHPPDVLPAQPNWTWTTSDGKTYQNVVVNKVEPDTVNITHSLGVAHVPMSTLPPDIQKQFNFDPAVAAAAKSEREREDAHPYYSFAELTDAQTAARQLNWPLAWICAWPPDLSNTSSVPNSEADLTQRSMNFLKTHAVVIFLSGADDLNKTSTIVRDQQFYQMDDGPIPGGHHFNVPKIVFTDAEISKPLGRVSHSELMASGEAAIEAVVSAIENGTTPPVPVPPAPTAAP